MKRDKKKAIEYIIKLTKHRPPQNESDAFKIGYNEVQLKSIEEELKYYLNNQL